LNGTVLNIPRWVLIAIVVAFNVIMVTAVPILLNATNSRFNECYARLAAHPNPSHGAGRTTLAECQSDWESSTAWAYLLIPIAILVDLALVTILLLRRHLRLRQ
jgi:hypothetical protein